MDGLNLGLSVAVLVLPIGFILGPLLSGHGLMGPHLGIGAFIAAMYVVVWAWFRPGAFVLSRQGLLIRWPLRRREIPLRDIEAGEILTQAEFRSRHGVGMRVGAGGFLGGFGLLVTSKGPTYKFYISRVDRMVVLRLRGARPLLITPRDPELFLRHIEELRGRAS
jgi:hypothetical protein